MPIWARALTFKRGPAALLLCAGAAWPPAGAQEAPTPASIIAELRENHAAEALRDAGRALEGDPGNTRLWILKGVAAEQTGRPALALAGFEAALRLEPDSVPALEGASETAFRCEPAKARAFTSRLLALQPDNAAAHGIAGMLAFDDRKWAEAAAQFEEAGPALGTQKSALEAQAIALDHLGKRGEAEAVLKRVTETWPADKDARYDLAVLETHEKNYSDALETLQPLLAAHDENALTLSANALEAQGKTPEAAALLRETIENYPDDPENYLQFAALSFDHSSFAAGIAMLDFGLKRLPGAAALYVARGALRMQVNSIDEAERDFATANRLDPSQSFGFEAQGLSQIQRHDLPAALARLQASLRVSPGNAYLHYLAAEVLKEGGAVPGSPNARQAIGYAERAVTLDPHLIAARNLLGEQQFQAGNYAEAEKQSRLVLERNPADYEAIYRLILVLRRTGSTAGSHKEEVAGLVARLKEARAGEHENQVRLDKYRLSVAREAQ